MELDLEVEDLGGGGLEGEFPRAWECSGGNCGQKAQLWRGWAAECDEG